VLSLAEQLGRPFRVMIHKDLLKIREMEPYSLPIDFSETKDALKNNMAVRHEAVRLLKEGVTIVVFPAGGVATAPKGFGRARDLPWKMLQRTSRAGGQASVIPMHFSGQNGRLFHLVSGPMNMAERDGRVAKFVGRASLTLRALRCSSTNSRGCPGKASTCAPATLSWSELEPLRDRKALLDRLYRGVFDLAPIVARRRIPFLPARTKLAA
jgi:putative hemolysin